jgi:SAM-dependent methyltransferase
MVNSFILFHEVPVDAAKHIVKEIYRILRPGGTFSVTDFGTGMTDLPPFERYSLEVNGRDNGEPYALDFVISDFKGLLTDVGFDVTVDANFIMGMEGVFGTKPDPSSNE